MAYGILFGRARGKWEVDDRLELESDLAEAMGLLAGFVALDDLVNGLADQALEDLPRGRGRKWVYRGWLLHPSEYAELHEALAERGDHLLVPPDAFELASCVPHWAPLLGDRTPPTVWTEDDAALGAWVLASEVLGPPPWIVKDHIKSAKEQWSQACFVPAGATFEQFAEICGNLVDIRGDRFFGGLVVRKFLNLLPIPYTTPFGQAHDEHRLIFWRGRLVAAAPYFDAQVEPLDYRQFAWLGREPFALLLGGRCPPGRRRHHGHRDQRRWLHHLAGADGPRRAVRGRVPLPARALTF